MPDLRKVAFIALTGVLVFGTGYSVIYNTYLDTSNPALTALPHPLSQSHYFASKRNFLNVYFIKRAWGWTSGAFAFLYLTSPPAAPGAAHEDAGLERMYKWFTTSACWMIFTSWFFGPAVLERVIAYSGGECTLNLPSGGTLAVPNEYCFNKAVISPATHPALFSSPSLLGLADLGVGLAGVAGGEGTGAAAESTWRAIPRLRRGHDISGHVFLLTMSILFLADQLRSSFKRSSPPWSGVHKIAVGANIALISIWLFSMYTTSVYFHTVFEKFTGYCKSISLTLD